MNKVIILEGPDGAGKTTLAHDLVRQLSGSYEHEGPPPEEGCALQFYASKLLGYLRRRKPVVADRFYLGEHVYGPVARDRDRLGKRGIRMMQRMTAAYGVLEVICLPAWEVVRANYESKLAAGDDYLKSEDKLWEVWNRYHALLPLPRRVPHAPAIQYRFDYHGKVGITAEGVLLNIGSDRRTLPLGAVGSPHAELLLVGEQSNTELDLPFLALGASSAYLDQCLQAAGVLERHVALVNAFDRRGPNVSRLKQTVAALGGTPTVVALGGIAQGVCRDAGLDPIVLPHPAHQQRFHHHKPEDFIARLRGAYRTSQGAA